MALLLPLSRIDPQPHPRWALHEPARNRRTTLQIVDHQRPRVTWDLQRR